MKYSLSVQVLLNSIVHGSVVELIPEAGETVEDAITFLKQTFVEYNRDDLWFYPYQTIEKEGKIYVTVFIREQDDV